jgi:hypothetical protein
LCCGVVCTVPRSDVIIHHSDTTLVIRHSDTAAIAIAIARRLHARRLVRVWNNRPLLLSILRLGRLWWGLRLWAFALTDPSGVVLFRLWWRVVLADDDINGHISKRIR